MNKQEKLDRHFLRLAWMTAIDMSKDPSTKVGAVIVTPDTRKVSWGYNGMPAGVEETPEMWERPEKYEWVVHAELNALINCPFDTVGCTVYVTMQPCHRCMVHLKNAGIKRIVFSDEYERLTHKHIIEKMKKEFDEYLCLSDPICNFMKMHMHDGFNGIIKE